MGILVLLGVVLAAGAVAAAVLSSTATPSNGGIVIVPAVLQLPVDPAAPAGTKRTELTVEQEVGKSGPADETFDVELVALPPGGKLALQVDVRATAYITPSNRFYNNAGHQFCRGVRITALLTRSQTGVRIDDAEQTANRDFCLAGTTPDKYNLVDDWYHSGGIDTRPTFELVDVGAGTVALRVTMRKLKWGDQPIVGEGINDPGHDPEWWAKHTGAYRYTGRVTALVETVPQ